MAWKALWFGSCNVPAYPSIKENYKKTDDSTWYQAGLCWCYYLDVLQKKLIQRNAMFLSIRQDVVFHCGGDQFRSGHFVQHEERHTAYLSLMVTFDTFFTRKKAIQQTPYTHPPRPSGVWSVHYYNWRIECKPSQRAKVKVCSCISCGGPAADAGSTPGSVGPPLLPSHNFHPEKRNAKDQMMWWCARLKAGVGKVWPLISRSVYLIKSPGIFDSLI